MTEQEHARVEYDGDDYMLPTRYTLADFRAAPSGVGPLAPEWEDKPHRLVYDLIREINRLREER